MQREGVDYFDTYSPVVQWSTIRLLLTMVLYHEWTTKQVDYTNAFVQAEIKEEVYVEQPKGFENVKDKVNRFFFLLKKIVWAEASSKNIL